MTQREEQAERRLVVVIDEAHEMSEAMLLELHFVMSHQMDSRSLFPVILVGQPELRKKLRLKKYEAISQRVGMQYHLQGMSKEETAGYVRYHMDAAKMERPVFAESQSRCFMQRAKVFRASSIRFAPTLCLMQNERTVMWWKRRILAEYSVIWTRGTAGSTRLLPPFND